MAKDDLDNRIKRARVGKRESKTLEFKSAFDPNEPRELVEVVKDLAAIANSGGGVIVVGLTSGATPTGADVSPVLSLDPAQLGDAVLKYTGTHFSGFEIREVRRSNRRLAAILVEPVLDAPLVFIKTAPVRLAPEGRFTRG